MKFKIGDKVQIKNGRGIKGYTGTWNFGMEPYVGKICEVLDTDFRCGKPCYHLRGGDGYIWDERGLIAANDTITIERHGQKVVAKMGKKVGVAKCAPEDEFDMFEGSLIALNRLFGKDTQEEKPEFREGDIVKVIKDDDWIPKDTIGRVEVVSEVNSGRILVKHTTKYGHDDSWWIDADKCKLVLKA